MLGRGVPKESVREIFDKSGGQAVAPFRGEDYDARQFLRTFLVELAGSGSSDVIADLDMNVSAATAQGFNGEVARDVKIRFLERRREILEFMFVGKIGHGAFKAGIRNGSEHHREIYLEAEDAGALFQLPIFIGTGRMVAFKSR